MAKPVWATNDVPTATDFNEWLTNVNWARKTANESITSSTTLQDDDELFVPVVANAAYVVDCFIQMDGATAGDFNFQFTGPASALFSAVVYRLSSTAGAVTDDVIDSMPALSSPMPAGCLGAGNTTPVYVKGTLITAGTAGNFRLQWAQLAGSVTATRVLTRSFLSLLRTE